MGELAASPNSLYEAISQPALCKLAAGQTIVTKAKETIDNDAEAFSIEMFLHA